MSCQLNRRTAVLTMVAAAVAPTSGVAQASEVWCVGRAYDALQQDLIRMIDIRSRQEWIETGVAQGAWSVSLHEDHFPDRLFAARELAGDRSVALICATGGRSGNVMRSLRQARYSGFVDVSEGMLGSALGPGWIAAGLPVVDIKDAMAALPERLT